MVLRQSCTLQSDGILNVDFVVENFKIQKATRHHNSEQNYTR